jgi:DUF1016 N-terminal domain
LGSASAPYNPVSFGSGCLSEFSPPTQLIDRVRSIWDLARAATARSVNSAHVVANWLSGFQIVEFEQGGAERAAYGQEVLKGLSAALMRDFGKGFSLSALKNMRAFYLGYPELLPIGHALRSQFGLPVTSEIGHPARDLFVRVAVDRESWRPGEIHPDLSWSHGILGVIGSEALADQINQDRALCQAHSGNYSVVSVCRHLRGFGSAPA